jgi:hypothetical protein
MRIPAEILGAEATSGRRARGAMRREISRRETGYRDLIQHCRRGRPDALQRSWDSTKRRRHHTDGGRKPTELRPGAGGTSYLTKPFDRQASCQAPENGVGRMAGNLKWRKHNGKAHKDYFAASPDSRYPRRRPVHEDILRPLSAITSKACAMNDKAVATPT